MSNSGTSSKVSIIVPVYKVEQYLEKCVDSILAQTYRNIEIILVDDGSPDRCPEICDEYAKKDNRIRVIHKGNGGLSDARNAGLKAATGEWVSFIDSDDWVSPNFTARLLETAVSNGADISVCAYKKVYEDGREVGVLAGESNKTMGNIEAMSDLFTYRRFGGVMTWNKLYRTKIFQENNITFPVGRIHEDNFTTYRTYYFANKVAYIDEPLLFYLQRGGSIMGQGFNRQRVDAITASKEASSFIKSKRIPLHEEVAFNEMVVSFGVLSDIHRLPRVDYQNFNDIEREIVTRIVRQRDELVSNRYARLKDKVRLYLMGNMPLYRALGRMM